MRRPTHSARSGRSAACFVLPWLGLAACAPPTEPVRIEFGARLADSPLACDEPADGLVLTDLRLFVHDLRLIDPDGREVPVALADRPPWQGASVGLLDFETGQGACRNGSAETNASLLGTVEPGTYSGLRFRIGVPASLNHANPLEAVSPLDLSAMHWHWSTGYKFLRAGVASEDDGFWIHLGSTRCEGTVSAPRGCRHANRPEVTLPGFIPGESQVIVDLAPLVAAVDLGDGAASDCSSGPAETACDEPFRALGLDFSDGSSTGTSPVFRVGRIE